MTVQIATAPGTWGVEPTNFEDHPPWSAVLDEIAEAGFAGTELGPLGYLPVQGDSLREALDERRLQLVAGYVMEPLQDAAAHARITTLAAETCRLLEEGGARYLVVIDGLAPERSLTAGRSSAATRLGPSEWSQLVRTVEAVAAVATDHGITAAFHPHAGTSVEFDDEIERLLSDVEVALCLDTGHCVYAGVDPVGLFERHRDRVAYLHCKDVNPVALESARAHALSFEEAVASGVFCPLGHGAVHFHALKTALDLGGYVDWATYEQDRLPNSPQSAFVDAQASLRHLIKVGIASEPALS